MVSWARRQGEETAVPVHIGPAARERLRAVLKGELRATVAGDVDPELLRAAAARLLALRKEDVENHGDHPLDPLRCQDG